MINQAPLAKNFVLKRYNKYMEENLKNSSLGQLDDASLADTIEVLAGNQSQENIWKLIDVFQNQIEQGRDLLIPVLEEEETSLFDIPKLGLFTPAKKSIRKVAMAKGGMALCAFTSEAELSKGQETGYQKVPMYRCFYQALEDDSVLGLLLNPWGTSILLDKQLLMLILNETKNEEEGNPASSIYVDLGEASDVQAEAVVNAACHPFSFEEPGSAALLQKAGEQLRTECTPDEEPAENGVVISTAGNLDAEMIIHAVLPVHPTEEKIVRLIRKILDVAAANEAQSVAVPAIGSEEGSTGSNIPTAVIAVAAWMNEHPDVTMSVTITCRSRKVYNRFKEYLMDED